MKRVIPTLIVAFAACALALCVGCSSGSSSSAQASSGTSPSAQSSAASSAAASSAAAASAPAASSAGQVPDGTYSVQVKLGGGTGRADVESPARLVVSGGKMTATIVWSSSNYDQMVVDGVQCPPVNSGGNSTFEIPVAALDVDLPVQAETTAMSEPHMIDYTLRFDSAVQT